VPTLLTVSSELSDELGQFVMRRVENVGHLEVLLLLSRTPLRIWEPAEITRELRGNQISIDRWLRLLVEHGLAAPNGTGYQFQPTSPELGRQVDDLARVFHARPGIVIQKIHSQPSAQLMDFVRAFEVRKKT
jgi:hypothetical protein